MKKNYLKDVFRKNASYLKSSSGNVESRSDNTPDNFPPKVRFFHRFQKKTLSPTPPPVLKNLSKLNIFPGKNFFSEKFIWTDKDTILTICFQSSENICPMSRKSLEEIDLTKKRPFTLTNLSGFVQSSFDNPAEAF